MPRIFGLNLIAVLLSGLAFWMVGFVFYGLVFTQAWEDLWNFTEAEKSAMLENAALAMSAGFLLSFFAAFMIGFALKLMRADGLVDGLKKAGFLWIGFAVPTLAYDHIYAGQPLGLLAIDGGHLLTGFLVMAAIQKAFK